MAETKLRKATERGFRASSVRTAAIVAIGTELLGDERLDTNSLTITSLFQEFGVEVVFKAVVGDAVDRMVRVFGHASLEADVVVVTGGLGPTRDDRTRRAAASFAGVGLHEDQAVLEWIEAMFSRRDAEMPASNRRQAEVLDGSIVLRNDRGTAPGLRFGHSGTTFFLLPGVPFEMEGLLESTVRPFLEASNSSTRMGESELRIACLPESLVEERLLPLYHEFGSQDVTILAKPGEVVVRLRSKHSRVRVAMAETVKTALGSAVVSRTSVSGPSATLEETVLELLQRAGSTVSTAESCTGGLIGQRLTSVAGSSRAYLGGAISYSNQLKSSVLGVDAGLIESYGAVSGEVAGAMAAGARERFASDWAVSVTGVAGPGGGTPEKPIGTVWFGLVGPSRRQTVCVRFPGNRERVRLQASQFALDMLRRALEETIPLVDSPWILQDSVTLEGIE